MKSNSSSSKTCHHQVKSSHMLKTPLPITKPIFPEILNGVFPQNALCKCLNCVLIDGLEADTKLKCTETLNGLLPVSVGKST